MHDVIGFRNANRERQHAAAAAVITAARVALGRGDLHPEDRRLLQARIDNPDYSLAELGAALGIGKDAYAARLRRVLAGSRRASGPATLIPAPAVPPARRAAARVARRTAEMDIVRALVQRPDLSERHRKFLQAILDHPQESYAAAAAYAGWPAERHAMVVLRALAARRERVDQTRAEAARAALAGRWLDARERAFLRVWVDNPGISAPNAADAAGWPDRDSASRKLGRLLASRPPSTRYIGGIRVTPILDRLASSLLSAERIYGTQLAADLGWSGSGGQVAYLRLLVEQGWIERAGTGRAASPPNGAGRGRDRHYYRLTEQGRQHAAEVLSRQDWDLR